MKAIKQALYSAVKRIFKDLNYRGLVVPIQDPPVSRKIFQQIWRKDYETPEIGAVMKLLKAGDRILELGSGLGIVSSLTSRAAPNVVVRSYEGNPDLISFIAGLHRRNNISNVTVINEILLPNPKSETIEFLTHQSFAESSVLSHGAIVKRLQIPCRDINEVIADFRPDIFICDIEGGEELLFQGIRLDGIRAMVIELHPAVISREAVRRVYDTCAEAGLYARPDLSSANVVAFEKIG